MINMAFMPLYMWEMWDVTPVTDGHTNGQWESSAVFSLSWIRNMMKTKMSSWTPILRQCEGGDHASSKENNHLMGGDEGCETPFSLLIKEGLNTKDLFCELRMPLWCMTCFFSPFSFLFLLDFAWAGFHDRREGHMQCEKTVPLKFLKFFLHRGFS